MSTRLAAWTTVAALLWGAAAAAQSPPPPPANEDCLGCHGDPDFKREDGSPVYVDQGAFDTSKHAPLACVDCHADLAAVTDFPHPEKLEKVKCASCHADEAVKYQDSIHAWAKEKVGLTAVAPACADCHGKHDIRGPADPESRVLHATVPTMCGRCHVAIKTTYDAGVHAAALKAGNPRAPVCIDCHTAHSIQRVQTESWKLSVTHECGTCHVENKRTFGDTVHGQVTALGFVRVATCADCHGAHDILAPADPASTVAPGHLVETCGRCHAGASASFVRYDPHADRHDRTRNAGLYAAGRFMEWLLFGVFVFFGLHTALWLARGLRQRREAQR